MFTVFWLFFSTLTSFTALDPILYDCKHFSVAGIRTRGSTDRCKGLRSGRKDRLAFRFSQPFFPLSSYEYVGLSLYCPPSYYSHFSSTILVSFYFYLFLPILTITFTYSFHLSANYNNIFLSSNVGVETFLLHRHGPTYQYSTTIQSNFFVYLYLCLRPETCNQISFFDTITIFLFSFPLNS